MKRSQILFVASLVANVVLAGIFLLRPSAKAPAASPPTPATHTRAGTTGAAEQRHEALLAALAAGDTATLLAAGVSPEAVHLLAAARAFGRLATLAREQDEPPAAGSTEYWRRARPPSRPPPTREQRAARLAAEREFETTMRQAFGESWSGQRNQERFGFLPSTQQERLRRIERDYEEMRRDLSLDSDGVELAADRQKQLLLDTEMKRDLAAALSPVEREQLELRTSAAASNVLNRYGDVIASEEEFKRLYALQKAFDDRFSNPTNRPQVRTPEENRLRAEAERQLNDEYRTALGDERWGTFPRENDGEYRTLATLATRLNLPATTADQVYRVRDTYSAQSLVINENPALSAADRRTQFIELANRARTELTQQLGPEGAEAYARQAGWLRLLQNGSAFATNSNARRLPPGSARPSSPATVMPPPRPVVSPPVPKS